VAHGKLQNHPGVGPIAVSIKRQFTPSHAGNGRASLPP
jgi:hypothetical protein